MATVLVCAHSPRETVLLHFSSGNILSNSRSSQCKWCWVLGGGQIVSGSGGRGNWTRNRLAQVVVLAQVLNCQLKSFIGNCKDYILKLATRIDNRPWY